MKLLSALFSRRTPQDTPKEPTTPAPTAVAIPDATEIPRYPSPGLAVPAVPAKDLIQSQAELVGQIAQTLGLTRAERADWLEPVLERYAAYVHLLPASETHHHCGIGGMLRHSLEVAFFAARFTEGVVFGMDLPPERRQPFATRARLIATFAGLLHDAGKPLVDIGAMDPASGALWNPHVQPLSDWLETRSIPRYTLFWHPGSRHRRHEAFGAALVHQILGQKVLAYLTEGEARGLLDVLFMAISATPDLRHPIAEAVKRGDSASVAFDLERQNTQTTQAAGGSVRSLAVRVIHAMQVCLRDGAWKPNLPGQPVWCTTQGVFLTYPDCLLTAIERIRNEGKLTVPSQPEVLLAALREARYIIPYDAGDTSDADTWPVTIHVTTGNVTRIVSLRALRLDRPDTIFGTEPVPAPLPAAVGDTPVEAATPAPIAAPVSAPTPAQSATTVISSTAAPVPVEQPSKPGPAEPDPKTPTVEEGSPAPAAPIPEVDDGPVIRNRRNEIDIADRRLNARAAAAAGPETAEQAIAWLDAHPPIGEFMKTLAAKKGIVQMTEHDGASLVAAFPKAFEGLGLAVGRIAEMLMQKKWVIPDASTQDRATITTKIGGKQQLAVRFTPQVSRVLGILLHDSPQDTPPAVPEPTVAEPPPAPVPASTPTQEKSSPTLPLSLDAEPDEPARRIAYRKVAFYQYFKQNAGAGAALTSLSDADVAEILGYFAEATGRDAAALARDLGEEPNPMFKAGTTTPIKRFRYDVARAQAADRKTGEVPA